MCSSCGCGPSKGKCIVCKIVTTILGLVGLFALVASAIGVYHVHFVLVGGFGTQEGSLSLLALVVSMMFIMKALKNCPCRGMGCASGCGQSGSCKCGMPGGKCMCAAGAPKM